MSESVAMLFYLAERYGPTPLRPDQNPSMAALAL
jgi:glutathione S-transferase